MRTTVDIDETVLVTAKAIARDEGTSIGAILSRLARKGLSGDTGLAHSSGFPTFPSAPDAAPITLDMVNEYRDGE